MFFQSLLWFVIETVLKTCGSKLLFLSQYLFIAILCAKMSRVYRSSANTMSVPFSEWKHSLLKMYLSLNFQPFLDLDAQRKERFMRLLIVRQPIVFES